MQKNKFKLYSFLFSAFASSALVYSLSSAPISHASDKDGKVMGDWKITCTKGEKDKKSTCTALQAITVKQDDKDVTVATYQFLYNEKKELKLIQILPQGVLLQQGTKIMVDKKMIAPGKFTICQTGVCYAAVDVTNTDLQTLTSNEQAAVCFLNGEGKQVNINMSTKGLKDAINTIK